MIVAKWKIDYVARELASPASVEAGKMEDKAKEAVRAWALTLVPEELQQVCAKYPQLNETAQIYFRMEPKGRSRTVYLEKFPFGDRFFEDSYLADEADCTKLCREWVKAEKAQEALQNSIRCALSRIATYAKFKNEFPEAYASLIALDKKESEGEKVCVCDEIEKVRANLKRENSSPEIGLEEGAKRIKDAPDTKLIDAKTIR